MAYDTYSPPNILGLRNYGWRMGVECLKCRHRAVLTTDDLIKHSNVGEMGSLDELARRARCGPCGGKGARWQPIKSAAEAKEWACEAPF